MAHPLVPVNPQPLEFLRARYPMALDYVFDPILIHEHGAIRPGECAANVFDFDDGLRLIVSRERMPDGVVIHVSASFSINCRMADEFRSLLSRHSHAAVCEKFIADVPQCFAQLCGDEGAQGRLEYVGSVYDIPHWISKEKS